MLSGYTNGYDLSNTAQLYVEDVGNNSVHTGYYASVSGTYLANMCTGVYSLAAQARILVDSITDDTANQQMVLHFSTSTTGSKTFARYRR